MRKSFVLFSLCFIVVRDIIFLVGLNDTSGSTNSRTIGLVQTAFALQIVKAMISANLVITSDQTLVASGTSSEDESTLEYRYLMFYNDCVDGMMFV